MGKIIQIVEDDEDIRFILEFILADSGFILETFNCIEAFISAQQKQAVDLFILDVRLPDGDGIELCRLLKNAEPTSKIPVIIMSAHANKDFALHEGKADHFIAKPFDLDTFVGKIKYLLNQAQ